MSRLTVDRFARVGCRSDLQRTISPKEGAVPARPLSEDCLLFLFATRGRSEILGCIVCDALPRGAKRIDGFAFVIAVLIIGRALEGVAVDDDWIL